MVSKDEINKLPTKLRREITDHLAMCINKATTDKLQSAELFLETVDEKHRSHALIAQGEINAFLVMLNLFKVNMGDT